MRAMRPKGPLINSTYKDDFSEKSMHGDDLCPYKKMKEFQYKPNNNDINNFLSNYKVGVNLLQNKIYLGKL